MASHIWEPDSTRKQHDLLPEEIVHLEWEGVIEECYICSALMDSPDRAFHFTDNFVAEQEADHGDHIDYETLFAELDLILTALGRRGTT